LSDSETQHKFLGLVGRCPALRLPFDYAQGKRSGTA